MRLFTNSLQYRYHVLPSSAKAVAAGARSRPRIATLLAFSAIYLLAVLFLRNHSYRDPTSWFFNPRTGYDRVYSDLRRQQASAFIEAASTQSPFIHVDQELSASSNKSLCLGIASIARENARYFRTAVGSLLDGLGLEERRDIHLVLFIAHTDPGVHPAYAEGWVQNVADRVLTYDLPEDKLNHVREMEKAEGDFREKGLFDYTYLLKACSDAGTPYVALLEDDVIAMDGWYHRTMDALGRAEEQSALMKASPDFLYLRLFYTEEFLGWNSEEWRRYLFWSLLAVLIPAATMLTLRHFARNPTVKSYLSNEAILVSCGVCIPLWIILFFAAGRITMLPLPHGVNLMNNFGCCSQGLVYPRHQAQALIEWYESKRIGYVDMLTEEYANEKGELRWALTPSVLQHVGQKSTKGDDFGEAAKYGRSVAEKLWNFAFELNDAGILRREHEWVKQRRHEKGV